MTTIYDDLFQRNAHGIEDWRILKAIAVVESSLQEPAYRFGAGERRSYKRYIRGKQAWMTHRYYDNPEILWGGFGLMQVTYVTATEHGFPREGDWWLLCDPETNVRIGANYLRHQLDRYGNLSSALSAYNAGTAFIDKGTGHFSNQWYVDRVMKTWAELRCFHVAPATPVEVAS